MIEIKNKLRSPIQLLIKSKTHPRQFSTLIVYGMGAGKNVYLLEDELKTKYIDDAEKKGLIVTRYIPNKSE